MYVCSSLTPRPHSSLHIAWVWGKVLQHCYQTHNYGLYFPLCLQPSVHTSHNSSNLPQLPALFPGSHVWVESLGTRLSQLPATLGRKWGENVVPHNTGLTWATILMATIPLMDFVASANVVLFPAIVTCSVG